MPCLLSLWSQIAARPCARVAVVNAFACMNPAPVYSAALGVGMHVGSQLETGTRNYSRNAFVHRKIHRTGSIASLRTVGES